MLTMTAPIIKNFVSNHKNKHAALSTYQGAKNFTKEGFRNTTSVNSSGDKSLTSFALTVVSPKPTTTIIMTIIIKVVLLNHVAAILVAADDANMLTMLRMLMNDVVLDEDSDNSTTLQNHK